MSAEGAVGSRSSEWAARMWPHVVMILVMVVVMAGRLGAIGTLLGIAVLIGCSIGCAARARVSSAFRAHVADLWAMSLLMLALLPVARSASGEVMPGMSMTPSPAPSLGHGVVGCAVIVGLWALARVLLSRHSARPRHHVVSGFVTGAGLVVMALV